MREIPAEHRVRRRVGVEACPKVQKCGWVLQNVGKPTLYRVSQRHLHSLPLSYHLVSLRVRVTLLKNPSKFEAFENVSRTTSYALRGLGAATDAQAYGEH